jgi:hypothetical protein
MAKREEMKGTEPTSIRLPTGWRDKVTARYAAQMGRPTTAAEITFTAAVIFALGRQFNLRYSEEANTGGRPPKTYSVTVATPHKREIVVAVFDDYAQPWSIASLTNVVVQASLPMTVVTLTADDDGHRESSTMIGRTIGLRMAREMAAAIEDAARGEA